MKKGVVMYYDLLEQLEDFSNEDFGKIMRAILKYDLDGSIPDFKGELKIAFKMLKPILDKNKQDYEQKCDQNRQNALNRWNATACDRMQSHNSHAMAADKDIDIDKDIDNINNKNKKQTNYDGIIQEQIKNEEVKNRVYEFIKMRKLIKKPMTDLALKKMLNKLKQIGNNDLLTTLAILDQSIANDWLDIYPLKNNVTLSNINRTKIDDDGVIKV